MSDQPLVPPAAVARWLAALPAPVAITGGTGFVGSHLVDTLCAAGVEPRVLVRSPASPRWIADRPVRWVEGSLEQSDALARLVDGAGTVIHLAGVVTADSAPPSTGATVKARRGWSRPSGRVRRAPDSCTCRRWPPSGPRPGPTGLDPRPIRHRSPTTAGRSWPANGR